MGSYGTWKGVPREQVPWHPMVDAEKCKGCRKCYEFCSHEVYAWDAENNKTRVAEPFLCVVGCSSCMSLCEEGAITFPPLTILKNVGKQTQ